MFHYRCDSTEQLKCKLDDLRALLSDPVAFKNIFRFAYDFAKVMCYEFVCNGLFVCYSTVLLHGVRCFSVVMAYGSLRTDVSQLVSLPVLSTTSVALYTVACTVLVFAVRASVAKE